MSVLQLWNLFVHVVVAGQVYRVNLVLVDEIQCLQLKVLELGLVALWLVEVENAFLEGLGTKLLNDSRCGQVLDWMVHKVVNDILDFHLSRVLEHPVNIFELKGLNLISTHSRCPICIILGTDNKPVLELHPNVLGNLLIRFLIDYETLRHACEQWLINDGA